MVKIYDIYFLESELIYYENVEIFLKEKNLYELNCLFFIIVIVFYLL